MCHHRAYVECLSTVFPVYNINILEIRLTFDEVSSVKLADAAAAARIRTRADSLVHRLCVLSFRETNRVRGRHRLRHCNALSN